MEDVFLLSSLHSLSLPSPSLSLASPNPFFPSPSYKSLQVLPLNQIGSLGELCKRPQWGVGQSPDRKRIWCTQELLESHWWQSFFSILNSEVHVLQKMDQNLAQINIVKS